MKSISSRKQVGSVAWRLFNYGVIPTFQYIFFEKFHKSTSPIHDSSKIISEIDLAVALGLDKEIILKVSKFYDEFIIACERGLLVAR